MDILSIILVVFLIAVGLGLGSSVKVSDMRAASKKPKAFATGVCSQYLFMPLFGYTLCQIFDFDALFSIGLVLTASAPGGTTSNLMTYWSYGDVALSISSLVALFMLPLLVIIYIDTTYDANVKIPYLNIVVTLLLLIIPTIIGMYVRIKSVKYATILEKIASIFGIIFLITAVLFGIITNSDEFDQHPTKWFCGFIMQIVGCGFGYAISLLLNLSKKDARTISLETGIQNSSLIIALIGLSFDGEERDAALIFPLMYSLLYVFNSAWIVCLFRFYLAPKDPDFADNSENEELDKNVVRMKEIVAEDIETPVSALSPTSRDGLIDEV